MILHMFIQNASMSSVLDTGSGYIDLSIRILSKLFSLYLHNISVFSVMDAYLIIKQQATGIN